MSVGRRKTRKVRAFECLFCRDVYKRRDQAFNCYNQDIRDVDKTRRFKDL